MKKLKKGFTLVELLVVIAILAILATVSVVGYFSFTEKAKVSNDTAVVSQVNSLLKADEALNGKPEDADEAFVRVIDVAEDGGYILEKLTPMSEGDILYDLDSNRCLLVDVDITSSSASIVYKDSETNIEDSEVVGKLTGNEDDDTLYFIYYTETTTSSVKCLYQKVNDISSLNDAFTNSEKGIVVSNSITISSTSVTLPSGLSCTGASLVNSTNTIDTSNNTENGIYIRNDKIFRITEGTTVTIGVGTQIVHDGQILLYGTLILEATNTDSDWYYNYYHTTNAIDVTEQFVIKSTGYLSMAGSGAGGFRTVTAEEGAKVFDGNFTWKYNGEGWIVDSVSNSGIETTTNMSSADTQNYIWKWVINDDATASTAGTASGGSWYCKSISYSGASWTKCDGSTTKYPYGYLG